MRQRWFPRKGRLPDTDYYLDLKPMAERVGPIEYAYLNGTVATWAPAQERWPMSFIFTRDSKAVGEQRTTTETTYAISNSHPKRRGVLL